MTAKQVAPSPASIRLRRFMQSPENHNATREKNIGKPLSSGLLRESHRCLSTLLPTSELSVCSSSISVSAPIIFFASSSVPNCSGFNEFDSKRNNKWIKSVEVNLVEGEQASRPDPAADRGTCQRRHHGAGGLSRFSMKMLVAIASGRASGRSHRMPRKA